MKKYISLLLLFIISFIVFQENVYAITENSSEIITGEYQYSAIEGNNKQNKNTFIYKDSDFTRSSYLGSKSLEVLSIQVASASLSWYGPELDKYEIDSSQNDYNIKNFLNKMKFKSIESNKYYNTEKKENSVGVIIGQKTIIQDGKEYTLLAIIPRSAGYKQEWAGNFTIGEGNIHEGFKSARDEILRYTKKYIEKNNIKGGIKVWTTGYSRGAAISNMVGGFFAGGGIDYFEGTVSITPEDVYCYTIGTPSSIKDGTSKNIELSVSANRNSVDYVNDTVGTEFNYTKGGTLNVNDDVYNGVRNIISTDDSFALLPPSQWGFTRYGAVISSDEGLYSEEEMLKELKSISEYVYSAYTTNDKRTQFSEKTLDLKSLSIVDKESDTSQIDFFKARLNGLVTKIGTNKIYNDEYQEALKSTIGTYGLAATFIGDISNSDINSSEMIYPLIYTYLAYVSDELQSEGRANSETEAITIAIEDLLTDFTGAEIDRSTFKIDDFVKIVLKYIADNENEPISDAVVSGIIGLVPDDYKNYLPMILNAFSTKENPTTEESLKAFIKACYYGPLPGTEAYSNYETPEDVRQLLYMTMVIAIGTDIPELQPLISNEYGRLDGHGKFEDFVDLMLTITKNEKNEVGEVIKTYSNIAELVDQKLIDLLDNLLQDSINQSEEMYSKEYKDDFEKQFNNLKQNITKSREILSSLFFYTEGGYNAKESLENALTFIQNASLIAMPHFDEIYLALSRTSNRYDDEIECIKGNNQTVEPSNNISLTFSVDYYLFKEYGSLYIDGVEVPKDKYTISKGSTVITIDSSYLNTLQDGNHTIVVKMNNKEAEANFTISKTIEEESPVDNKSSNNKNPNTSDDIFFYISLLGLSLLVFIKSRKYKKIS